MFFINLRKCKPITVLYKKFIDSARFIKPKSFSLIMPEQQQQQMTPEQVEELKETSLGLLLNMRMVMEKNMRRRKNSILL